MQKKSLTNKITKCCNLPFGVMIWIIENLTLNTEADRNFLKNNLHQNGTLSIDGWKVWINSGTLESDASLTKAGFLAWFDCERQPSCAQLKLLIEGFKLGNYNPINEYGVGWTEMTNFEVYNEKVIKKIIGYSGGVGSLPQELNDRIGKYYGEDSNLTTDKNLAVDFKGEVGNSATANIPEYSTLIFPVNQGSMFYKDGIIWVVKTGQQLNSGDVIEEGVKLEMLGGDTDSIKKALKYFLNSKLLDDLSENAGDHNIYNKDLTVAFSGNPDNSSIYKYDLTDADVLDLKFKVPNDLDPTNLAALVFENEDGSLVYYKNPNPLSVIEEFSEKINVSNYKSVTLTWDAHAPKTFKVYQSLVIEDDSVKNYMDEKILPIRSFSDGSVNPKLLETYDKTKIVTNPFINGVQNYLNNILLVNNTIVSYIAAGVQIYIWKDVPTKINGTKRIVKLDLDFTRIGGTAGSNTNLLGIKKDGTIVNIVPSQYPTPSGKLEKISIDLKPYEKFSLQLVTVDSNPDSPKIKIKTYENGEIEEDSVLKFIEENGGSGGGKIISENLLMIDKPTSAPIINIVGKLPTDASPTRTPTNIEFEYIMNNRIVFKCKSTLAIQGNATATFAKKGFETAFKNYNDTELKVQFGEWAAFSEFNLKAYPNDQTFARDLTAGKLWHQIRKNNEFPKSYIADFNGGKLVDSNKENLHEQSLFYTEGFPVEFRLNGNFYGIYILRMKKDRDNYMMNNANVNHIFIDNEEGVNWTTFTPSNWKLRSPKVSGDFTNTVLLGKMNRWWDWFKGINDNTIDFESTVGNYLNIESWVDDIILQQVTAHWDYQVNNILLTSWDGLKLSICYYDGDQTFGFVLNSMSGFEFPLTVDSNGLYWRSDFWRGKLYPKLLSRIKTRYTELRNNKILNSNNVYQLFKETTDMIPRDLYEKEMNAWRISRPDEGIHNVRYCMNWFKERLVKLDLIWKL